MTNITYSKFQPLLTPNLYIVYYYRVGVTKWATINTIAIAISSPVVCSLNATSICSKLFLNITTTARGGWESQYFTKNINGTTFKKAGITIFASQLPHHRNLNLLKYIKLDLNLQSPYALTCLTISIHLCGIYDERLAILHDFFCCRPKLIKSKYSTTVSNKYLELDLKNHSSNHHFHPWQARRSLCLSGVVWLATKAFVSHNMKSYFRCFSAVVT